MTELRRPVILIFTPYSPTVTHGHAVDDIGLDALEAISGDFEVHVFAPAALHQPDSERLARAARSGIRVHLGSQPRNTLLRHFGVYPAACRKDWTRRNTREALRVTAEVQPDIIHSEYLQPSEVVLRLPSGSTTTLHDVSTTVFRQRMMSTTGPEKLYRFIEYARVALLEGRLIRRAERLFALSDRDASALDHRRTTARDKRTRSLRIGLIEPARTWDSGRADRNTAVFAGAMWRDANARAAQLLVCDVMPLVWQKLPDVELRVVGAGPPEWLRSMASSGNVSIVGSVESLDEEYLRAGVVLCPSVVDAGILLKVARGLACGVPMVLNAASATPVGVVDGESGLVRESPAALAEALVDILTAAELARRLAAGALRLGRDNFSWRQYALSFAEGVR